MKRVVLFFVLFMSLSGALLAQDKDCERTCVIEKIVYEGTYLGVQFGTPCDKDLEEGVVILKVVANSPAEKFNIKPFDILLGVNDIHTNRRGDIIKLITAHKPFEEAKLTIYRKGKVFDKTVRLGAKTTKIIEEKVCCEEVVSIFDEDNINVFPIPAESHVTVSFKKLEKGNYNFGIYLANGRLIKTYNKLLGNGALEETIPVDKLQDGVYILKISNEQGAYSKLFVVGRK